MYNILIRPFVKRMDKEKASGVALRYFKLQGKIPGGRFLSRHLFHSNRPEGLEREVFGLTFYNPLGLGPGLDCSGVLYNDLNDLGFSFVEIGPFNKKTIYKAIKNIQKDPPDDILAANINNDFLPVFTLAYDFFDFFVFSFTEPQSIEDIMDSVLEIRLTYDEYKPVLVSVGNGMTEGDLRDLADYCLINRVDGLVIHNLDQISFVHDYTGGKLPIVANCHIITVEEADASLKAGASLLEIRSGLVRNGPGFINKIHKYLLYSQTNDNRK